MIGLGGPDVSKMISEFRELLSEIRTLLVDTRGLLIEIRNYQQQQTEQSR